MQAHSLSVQFGSGFTRSAPLGLEEPIQIKSDLALEHKINGPAQFVSQDAQGFAFSMRFLQTAQKLLALKVVT